MAELNYNPDASARSLRTGRTRTLGLVVSDISNPFFSTLVKGVENAARLKGYTVLICNTDESFKQEALYLRDLAERRVDGVVVSPAGHGERSLHFLRERSIRFTLIDRTVSGVPADSVLSDNIKGARQAVEHLIKNGHQRIGLVVGMEDLTSTEERLQGCLEALTAYGIKQDPRLVIRGNSRIDGGKTACEHLLAMKRPPTAIFTLNNLMTIGAAGVILGQSQIKCPEDVSLIGFDDPPWASFTAPPLTTVAQDPYKIGESAGNLLLKRLECEQEERHEVIRVPAKLVIRQSVAARE